MSLPQGRPRFTFEDYLAWEATQELRHEYLAGEVFAMTGARDTHVVIALNVAGLLRAHVRGSPCSSVSACWMCWACRQAARSVCRLPCSRPAGNRPPRCVRRRRRRGPALWRGC